jgi:hypothetical protein
LGKFEDVRRSAARAMKWAKDFRMDAPWSQRGENTSNPWSDTGNFQVGGVSVMIDNFAIPAATVRGLFDLDYRADRLILRPRVPGSIVRYDQKEPVRFGKKKIYLTCRNGGPFVRSVKVNGKPLAVTASDEIALVYEDLPDEARVEIATKGGWPEGPAAVIRRVPVTTAKEGEPGPAGWPEPLARPYADLVAMRGDLADMSEAGPEAAFVDAAIASFEACRARVTMDPGPGYFRAITPERRKSIERFYEQAALGMYKGFANRMGRYAAGADVRERRIASLWPPAGR